MLNQTVLVGRITTNPELKTLNNDKKGLDITLAIPRSYKNEEGIYDTDFITCKVWNGVAENVAEYCKKGDIVGPMLYSSSPLAISYTIYVSGSW